MTLYLAPEQNYELKIANYDCTGLLIEARANFPQWTPGQGLLISTGSFILRDNYEFAEVLDDRLNSRWAQGRQVVFKINGSLAPICGTHYIDSSSWDGDSLVINTTCRLGLANYITPSSLGICINLNESARLSTVMTELLKKAGISNAEINLSGFFNQSKGRLYETMNVPEGTSLVQLAAQIAASQGFVIYQRNDGQIVVNDITSLLKKRVLISRNNFDLATYDRLPTGDIPPSQVIVTGSFADKFFTDKLKVYEIVKRTGESTAETTTKNVETDFQNRQIVVISDTRDNLGFRRNYTEETSKYEAKQGNGFGTTGVEFLDEEKCTEADEGRLYERTIKTYSDATWGLQQWIDIGKQSGAIQDGEEPVGNVLVEQSVETFTYNMPELKIVEFKNSAIPNPSTLPNQANASNYYVQTEKLVYRAIGVEIPLFAKFEDLALDPTIAILAEVHNTQWKLDTNLNTWSKTRAVYQTRYSQFPEQIQARLGDTGRYPLSSTVTSAKQLVQTVQETEEDSPPPNFGRMPAEAYVQYTPFRAIFTVFGTSNANKREITISLGEYPATAADAMSFAETFARWLIGRYKAMNITIPLTKVNNSFFDDFVPTRGTCAIREVQYNTLVHYAIDGASLLFTPQEAFINFQGVMLGSEGPVPIATQSINSLVKPNEATSVSLAEGGGGRSVDLEKLGYDPVPGGLSGNTALKTSGLADLMSGNVMGKGGGGDAGGGDFMLDFSDDDLELKLDELFGADKVPLLTEGDAYPNIDPAFPRESATGDLNVDFNGPDDFDIGGQGDLGGASWENQLYTQLPLPSFNFFTGPTNQSDNDGRAALQGDGDISIIGGGGGGDLVGGSVGSSRPGIQFPQNVTYPARTGGSGNENNAGGGAGGGGGGGIGFIGGGGGGGGSGITGQGYGTVTPFEVPYVFAFYDFLPIPPDSIEVLGPTYTVNGLLDKSEEYWSKKSVTLTSS